MRICSAFENGLVSSGATTSRPQRPRLRQLIKNPREKVSANNVDILRKKATTNYLM